MSQVIVSNCFEGCPYYGVAGGAKHIQVNSRSIKTEIDLMKIGSGNTGDHIVASLNSSNTKTMLGTYTGSIRRFANEVNAGPGDPDTRFDKIAFNFRDKEINLANNESVDSTNFNQLKKLL